MNGLASKIELVGILSTDGRLLECNCPTRDEMIGRPFWEAFAGCTQEELRAAIGRAARGEAARCEVKVPQAKGVAASVAIGVALRPIRDEEGRFVYLLFEGRERDGVPASVVTVRGTELSNGDTHERHRQKIARITLDSMVQFVGLLDAKGTVLEINQVALDAVGIKLSDVEGRPFWTTFWWQVSEEINATLRDSIRRAAEGEFVRWDAEIYGRAGGKETIIIDASLMPVKDDQGNVVFIAAEGRDITEKKAHEREIARQREELAKLDVLKTQFFANISHEFRTPLTLMLGPLEDLMALEEGVSPRVRESLLVAHRNSLRLLRLVNSLLDFSRIEAGRIQATFEPTDVATLTAELASNFRSAMEKAGIELVVECAPLAEMVHVDREMWEKVVLNFLSNAFKYTFEGRVTVRVEAAGGQVVLSVADTGTGIPEHELPHLFERFHRVEGARGRTLEGSGIGLALVAELVKLHGGRVDVKSRVGEGSTFSAAVPLGTAHLPAERVGAASARSSTAIRAEAYVEEALRWLPEGAALEFAAAPRATAVIPGARVLIADDNADMRAYVRGLLEGQYEVAAVTNGAEALRAAVERPPDLVLADVMMPELDGFGLVQGLRADPRTSTVPVILLSARAGEEARSEGMDAGADDYLVKPFSARELVARVNAHLRLSRARKAAEEQATRILESITDGFLGLSRDWRITHANAEAEQLSGMSRTEMAQGNYWELFPAWKGTLLEREFHRAVEERIAVEFEDFYVPWNRWYRVKAYPAQDGGLSVFYADVTGPKRAEQARKQSEERLQQTFEQAPVAIVVLRGAEFIVEMANPPYQKFVQAREVVGRRFADVVPDIGSEVWDAFHQVMATGQPYVRDEFYVPYDQDGDGVSEEHWFNVVYHPLRENDGAVSGLVAVCVEVTPQVLARKELERANRELEEFAYVASHDLQEPLRMVNIYTQLLLTESLAAGETAHEYAGYVRQGVKRMEELIKGLLSYSRAIYKDGTQEGAAQLSESLAQALANVDGRLQETGGTVTAGPLPVVRGDTAQLAHVFQNLLSNSLKYRRNGVVPEIEIATRREGNQWHVSVRDNGIGFDPKYAERIFGLFKRLHKDEYPGTGLGLAISQRIVERYGGRMWAEGQPGSGATFWFVLPTVTEQ